MSTEIPTSYLDKVAVKPLFLGILVLQIAVFYGAAHTTGWLWYGAAIAYMVSVFASIPCNETMVVRYIDNSMRSRVSGVRIAVSFGISSLAVYVLGPFIKASGFTSLMLIMSAIACVSALIVSSRRMWHCVWHPPMTILFLKCLVAANST